MKPLFADTSFYVALLNPRDLIHAKALQVGEHYHRPVLLSDFVLLELGNMFTGIGQRSLFSKLTSRLYSDPNVRIIPASRNLLEKGLFLFSHREDKEWSLTDCTSFIIMQEEGLTEALTTDHHFEQAGFTILLR